MLSHIAGSEEMVKSFVREARLASYLKHQNVAQTYDLGRVGDVYFIVMELITGRNLREVLRHCGATTGPMPVPIALTILNQICDALDYAHNLKDEHGKPLGIIHRDVSPSNIIVSDTGVVKLIDFGIAKASGAGMQTLGGTLKGKFAYMAPEYINGKIDARADLFAIGVIAHELLTNRPLFSGRDDIDTLTRVRDMHIDPPSHKNPQVPPEIDDVVMTALARDPERRWQHATALRTAMTTLTHRLGLVASNAQVVEWLDWAFTQRPAKKRRRSQQESDTEADGEAVLRAIRRNSLGPGESLDSMDDLDSDDASISISGVTGSGEITGQGSTSDPIISIEERTAQLVSINQKRTLIDTREPVPPAPVPRGSPMPGSPASPARMLERSGPIATIIDASSMPQPIARSSQQMQQQPRAHSPSSAPPMGRPSAGSIPPPIGQPAMAAVSPISPAQLSGLAPQPVHASTLLSAAGAPVSSPSISAYPAPVPGSLPPGYGQPALQSGVYPRAARPSSPPPIAYGAQRPSLPQMPAQMQSGALPRIPAPPSGVPARPPRSSHLLAVVLVVLAAAIAAITVYFVLPLLT
jgi:serine/threonine protein kinase